jgi:hypothetical protein
MPAIITNKFRIHNSEQFAESFSEASPTVYYLGIGRPQPFDTSTRGDLRTENEGTDTTAITPSDSVYEEFNTFQDLLAVKKIVSSGVSYCIPRRNWITGTVYDYYRHDYGNYIPNSTTSRTANSGATTLFDSKFYILNSENNVYKCLDNNNNSASTSEPTGTSTSIIQTGDNYKWKYMYTLSSTQLLNFLSTDFMAVSTNSTVSSVAVDGTINIIKIVDGGSSGTNGTYTGIPIRGNGTGGTVTVGVSGNAVSSITITNVGSGYTYAYIKNSDIVSAGSTGLTGSKLDCIIGPKGGHGFDAVKELGGFFVMLNVSLEGKETSNTGDFTSVNDFRRIVLIRDPKSNGSAASSTTLRATKAVHFAASPTPGTFLVDETITQTTTGATGKVVEWDATNRILYYIQTRFNNAGVDSNGNLTAFSGVNVITGSTSSATGTPSSVASETVNQVTFTNGYVISEIDANSGDVLYIENRAPINRAADQTENIKLVIEF